ncbi:carbohydrate ABC transporter permease [Butyrivibrio proteoclasticus]|uniref:carbohydrate ABC transporter permease n=1 Tax=Butyrivibrio proteoclasticus TaxID=43305 RepID=UPI0009DD1A8E|nr:carbohydrate ABC transporter permease [Butyrivibrio proteoclasticus]
MSKEIVAKTKIKMSTGDKVLEIICYVIFAIAAFLCIYPFYYVIINTFSANDVSARGDVLFWPVGFHVHNYTSAFRIDGLPWAFFISLSRTVLGTACTVIASAWLGFMFTQQKMFLRKFWYRLVVATMYFNAGIIPWYLVMKQMGLTNNFMGYIWPAVVSPFNLILTKTFVESVPKELQEAAEIDGAGIFTIFFRVIAPVIKPIMATVAIFSAVGQWNAFQDTLLLVTDQKLYPLQFVLYQYLNQASSLASLAQSNTSTSSLAAAAATTQTTTSVRMTITVIVVIPIMLVYPIFQKYFVKGIMIGAVKG